MTAITTVALRCFCEHDSHDGGGGDEHDFGAQAPGDAGHLHETARGIYVVCTTCHVAGHMPGDGPLTAPRQHTPSNPSATPPTPRGCPTSWRGAPTGGGRPVLEARQQRAAAPRTVV